jgi:hemolysin activation/secretion protein
MYRWIIKKINKILGFGLCCSCLWSFGDADREEQKRRAEQIYQEQQARQQAPRLDESPHASLPYWQWRPQSDASSCFTLKQTSLVLTEDHEKFRHTFSFIQKKLDHLVGQCFDQKTLGELIEVLGNEVLLRGYTTTRIGFLNSDLQQGQLKLQIIPGLMGIIQSKDNSTTYRHVFPIQEGELFDLRAIEQGLEHIKRIPSMDVSMDITPAERPWYSNVLLDIKKTSGWNANLSHDDAGSKSTGKRQATATLGRDDLFGWADLAHITYGMDVEEQRAYLGQNNLSLYYQVPWHYWTFTLTGNQSRYYQTVFGSQRSFVSRGQNRSAELKAEYLVYRDQQHKNSTYCRLGRRFSHSYMDSVEIQVQKRNLSHLECGISHRSYVGEGQIDATFAQKRGLGLWGAMPEFPSTDPHAPRLRYRLYSLDLGYTTPLHAPFPIPMNYSINLRAQRAATGLYGSEQIGIGGRFTVRGFDGEYSGLSAEHGWYVRQDLSIPLSQSRQTLYLGADLGNVYDRNTRSTYLAGAVLGLRGQLWKHLNYDVFLGTPLYVPAHIPARREVFGFNINYTF